MNDARLPAQTGKQTLMYVLMGAAVFFCSMAGYLGNYTTKKTFALVGCIVSLLLLVLASRLSRERLGRLITPTALAMFLYMLLGGLSTFYAKSGKFAISEFSAMLIAFTFFIAIVLFAGEKEVSFRKTAGVLAAAAVPVGILSMDAASSNLLMPFFRLWGESINSAYTDTIGVYFASRLNTIIGNPNLYAGIMSVACLLSLWLLFTAESRKQKLLWSCLTLVNTAAYILAFSMGSLGVFAVAALVMLACCPKEGRIGFFLLLAQTAVIALGTAAMAVSGFGETVTGSAIPLLSLAAGCVLYCLSEVGVRGRLTRALSSHGKLLLGIVLAMVAAAVVYIVLALQLTGPFAFGGEREIRRTADLPAGEYSLTVEASAPVSIQVYYKNMGNLIQNNETILTNGTSDKAISFTVPEDSELVFFRFGGKTGDVISSARYEGVVSGELNLGYKLLPEFIADRIQDLSANGNVVQRGVYRQDAIRLFLTSPIFGRGLGGFENGVVSVQDYYYETTHAHNHYVQVLCDLGILGLISFLALLAAAVWCLFRAREKKPWQVMALAGCLVQMFGQAVTDLTWSVGCCMVLFFGVLGMTALCDEPVKLALPARSRCRRVRLPLMGFLGLFAVLIGLNLYAKASSTGDHATINTLKNSAYIDLFEKNDYKLSYLLNGGDEEGVAEQFAADLQAAESNSITIPLAQYYISAGEYDAALDTLEQGSDYMRADEEVWQKLFSLCERMIDPTQNLEAVALMPEKDRYLGRIVGLYEKLCRVNEVQLDTVELTAGNYAFLGKLLTAAAVNGDGMDRCEVFRDRPLDTRYAPDVDGDGVPDFAKVVSGSVTWGKDGSLRTEEETVLRLTPTVCVEGSYLFVVGGTKRLGEPISHTGSGEAIPIELALPADLDISYIQYLRVQ